MSFFDVIVNKFKIVALALFFKLFEPVIRSYYLKHGIWHESSASLSITFFIRSAPKTINKFSSVLNNSKYPDTSTEFSCFLNKIKAGCSVSRFGDGEYAILKAKLGNQVYFDTATLEAKCRLREVLEKPVDNHIVCLIHKDVVASQLSFSNTLSQFKGVRSLFRGPRMPLLSEYDNDMCRLYGELGQRNAIFETGIFRNTPYQQQMELWENQNVLYITGSRATSERYGYTVEQMFSGANSIEVIETVTEQALSQYYERILNEIVLRDGIDNKLIMISQGMAGSVLAYDLAKLGIQAIDFGQPFVNYN